MIRMAAIPSVPQRRKGFGPFTSGITAAAMVGIYIGMASILIDKF
ncbi:MAG: hypothetical protein R3D89_13865 [Sphingomonadaceae bacterium]